MLLPKLTQLTKKNVSIDTFLGLNQKINAAENELYETRNMSADYYPMLATREHRGVLQQLDGPKAIAERDAPVWISAGKVWYNGLEVTGLSITGSGPRQLISMGAYVLIWPDRLYFNTVDLEEYGSIDAHFSVTATETAPVTLTMTDMEGSEYNVTYVSATEPENPSDGEYWIDTSESLHTLNCYSASMGSWTQIATSYVKISCSNIDDLFTNGDGVDIMGIVGIGDMASQLAALNGSFVIQSIGANYITIIGMLDEEYTITSGTINVDRKAPKMDYLTECGNRLWGCYYGIDADGAVVNELYCCKLGDFKNWNVYSGISTDSWAASRGGDGQWTGAGTISNHPVFFRENAIEMVYPATSGAHQVTVIEADGCQKGSWRSIVAADDVLYYLSNTGIQAFSGSRPTNLSGAKIAYKLFDGRAGYVNKRYYLSAKDKNNDWHMLAYDGSCGLWHEEDATKALMFAKVGQDIYYIDEATSKLMSVFGAGTAENDFHWSVTFGITGFDSEKQKRVSRFVIRGKLPQESNMTVWLEYDDSGIWERMADVRGNGLKSWTLPIKPRRCDTCRIKLTGKGDALIMSVHKDYTKGSDLAPVEE